MDQHNFQYQMNQRKNISQNPIQDHFHLIPHFCGHGLKLWLLHRIWSEVVDSNIDLLLLSAVQCSMSSMCLITPTKFPIGKFPLFNLSRMKVKMRIKV
ncbi:hypothetical protein AAZX31_10G131500 [Glycine max]